MQSFLESSVESRDKILINILRLSEVFYKTNNASFLFPQTSIIFSYFFNTIIYRLFYFSMENE